MLKIKDNFDLKELKKFGFTINEKEWYQKECSNGKMFIFPLSRKIVYEPANTVTYIECNQLYDLIQADLVEKI